MRQPARLRRAPQLRSPFEPGDPLSGYYNDLTLEVRSASPVDGVERLRRLIAAPQVNFTSIAQLGIGAWQLAKGEPAWLQVTRAAANWLAQQLDDRGRLVVPWAMTHTYALEPPWISAMTQGEAVSLFLRAAPTSDSPGKLLSAAASAATPLLGPSPVVTSTPEGPVLQEYPTDPPAHVLNGWIFALWGLYDLSRAEEQDSSLAEVARRARSAFEDGIAALAARLRLYDTLGWSRYDLYPHPIVHVASPFYHRLHIEMLRATNELAPNDSCAQMAARWEQSSANPAAHAMAVSRKVAFRLIRPRIRRARTSKQ